MPRSRRAGRARSGELTDVQYWELLIGGAPDNADEPGSAFASEAERKAAWERHGAFLDSLLVGNSVTWATEFYSG